VTRWQNARVSHGAAVRMTVIRERPMQIPIYQVDAFTDRLFGGNPAAICPLDAWLPDTTLQAIAAENNLAETAYVVRDGADYALRWFTPTVEVDLCGHATLASAHVIFNKLEPGRREVAFHTLKAGTLWVKQENGLLAMDFPSRPAKPISAPAGLAEALGRAPLEVLAARDLMAVYERAADVAALAPDFAALAKLDFFAVIVTAPGDNGLDFISRFFAPAQGIPEDPATGSSHCTLTPYWAHRLGRTRLQTNQISPRRGKFTCTLNGDRVVIAGNAVLYLEGQITV
jgi:PhzF family phenazine biosynthesis protein